MSLIDNDVDWVDTAGHRIDCHEGMILRVGDTYYWYGRSYAGNDGAVFGERGGKYRCGIVCCSSTDLVNWSPTWPVLTYPDSGPWTTGTWHRPRLLFNAKTRKFVLWFFHLMIEPFSVTALIATADRPEGPFTIEGPATMPGHETSGDHDLFRDEDGRAYLASGDFDRSGLVSPLADDLLSTTGGPFPVIRGGGKSVVSGSPFHYEGYALTKYHGLYLYAASGTVGLHASETSYAIADQPLGPYEHKGYMSEHKTWGCQISSILHIPETDTLMALCDRWLHDNGGQPVREARHSAQQWFPISVDPVTRTARMLPLRQWNPALPIGALEALADGAELVAL